MRLFVKSRSKIFSAILRIASDYALPYHYSPSKLEGVPEGRGRVYDKV